MKERNVPSTEHIRQAYVNFCWGWDDDSDDAELDFDLWLVSERHRVANLAIEKTRKRIIANILDRVEDLNSCTKNDNCQELGQLIKSYIPEWMETE